MVHTRITHTVQYGFTATVHAGRPKGDTDIWDDEMEEHLYLWIVTCVKCCYSFITLSFTVSFLPQMFVLTLYKCGRIFGKSQCKWLLRKKKK